MKRIFLLFVVMLVFSACGSKSEGSNQVTQEEQTTEPSTRVPNSIIGKWYTTSESSGATVSVWEFKENGYYYRREEEWYNELTEEEREKNPDFYRIEDGIFITDNGLKKYEIQYTDYGFNLININKEQFTSYTFYEYRQDALEADPDYLTSDEYFKSMADEYGRVIIDNVLVRYYVNEKEVRIPGNVKTIAMSAFNEQLVDCIVIEDGVEEIGDWAFCDTHVKKIYFPASVTKIGKHILQTTDGSLNGSKIYVEKGSYAEEYFKESENRYGAELVVQ